MSVPAIDPATVPRAPLGDVPVADRRPLARPQEATALGPDHNREAPGTETRRQLVKRLADVICIPASQLTPQERHMAGDVLVELLRQADLDIRESVARRLVMLNEAPRTILVLLAKDDIRVARHVLEESGSLTDSDMIQIANKVSAPHRKVMAQRRHLSDAVVDALVQFLEEDVVETLLANKGANFSETALQRILTVSRNHHRYVELLIRREELRPSHGLTMFWWADGPTRTKIIKRFGVTRHVLQEACPELFAMAAEDGWQDAPVRKALQFIERRQRNRAAAERSPHDDLEAAIKVASEEGLTRRLTEEISYMAGVKPATGAQILTDRGGEGLAILCKAPGLKRDHLIHLWRALGRPAYMREAVAEGAGGGTEGKAVYHPDLARVIAMFDSVSTDKAQTILRYWNWSLTSALNADILRLIKNGVIPREEDYGAAAITASLVFSHRPSAT